VGRLRCDDLAAATVRGYHYDLDQFLRWFIQTKGSSARFEKLSILDLINYRQYLVNIQALKPATINRRLKALRRFCRCCRYPKEEDDDTGGGFVPLPSFACD
jgi:integrase/recombinase XerC